MQRRETLSPGSCRVLPLESSFLIPVPNRNGFPHPSSFLLLVLLLLVFYLYALPVSADKRGGHVTCIKGLSSGKYAFQIEVDDLVSDKKLVLKDTFVIRQKSVSAASN